MHFYSDTGGRSEPAPVNRLVVPLFGDTAVGLVLQIGGCRDYPLDPHPHAVGLYSGCTLGKRRAWYFPDDRQTASLVGLRGGWRHARTKIFKLTYGSNAAVPGSGDLLIEFLSALQTKSFLLANTFLDSSVTISPHNSLNTSRGIISEPDLLSTPESEILEGFSDKGAIQVRRITIKKDAKNIPTKHLILTLNSPKLPSTTKAGYLNCKNRPYIPNPLRCFKCQRFGHSQTSCSGQLTCSRCASVGHTSTDGSLEPKCINCSQPHTADSKLCPSIAKFGSCAIKPNTHSLTQNFAQSGKTKIKIRK
ncbi:uncharacterized protein TNCV_5139721 [Trichonephila clavipes]|nr:uncharacterized protein TNCV_5139721 [Trichonephila clavipes]